MFNMMLILTDSPLPPDSNNQENVRAIYVKNDNKKEEKMRHRVASHLIQPSSDSAIIMLLSSSPAVSVAEVDVAQRN